MTNIEKFQLEVLEFLKAKSGEHKQKDLQQKFEHHSHATIRDGLFELANNGYLSSKNFIGHFKQGVGIFQINAAGIKRIEALKNLSKKEGLDTLTKKTDIVTKIIAPLLSFTAILISFATLYLSKCQDDEKDSNDLKKVKETLDTTNVKLQLGVNELKGIKDKLKRILYL